MTTLTTPADPVMRDDFAAFILTHGRPHKVFTYETLKRAGYTGKIYIIIDNEDEWAEQYREVYGDKVLMFDKADIAARFDEGDNFNDRRAIFYARNACWELAEQVGVKHFIQLDDDYKNFRYRIDGDGQYTTVYCRSIDRLFSLMVDYLDATPFLSVAMSQGGDHIGGGLPGSQLEQIKTKRKAMNTFVCSTEKPFRFMGKVNEDVNTYTALQRRGGAFISLMSVMVDQVPTQSSTGGMTELYVDTGTYIKSFYSVMYCPSSVTINMMGPVHRRLHHRINWRRTAPCIIDESHRKVRA